MRAKNIAEFYNRNREREWDRLTRSPYHRLEFLVCMTHITAHLQPGTLVLDAGGGPGRYTLELARRGYDVVLLDISKGEIELAKTHIQSEPPEVQARVKDVIVGRVPCHFFRAQELRELAETHGLETILMAGGQGLSEGLPEATNALFEDQGKME